MLANPIEHRSQPLRACSGIDALRRRVAPVRPEKRRAASAGSPSYRDAPRTGGALFEVEAQPSKPSERHARAPAPASSCSAASASAPAVRVMGLSTRERTAGEIALCASEEARGTASRRTPRTRHARRHPRVHFGRRNCASVAVSYASHPPEYVRAWSRANGMLPRKGASAPSSAWFGDQRLSAMCHAASGGESVWSASCRAVWVLSVWPLRTLSVLYSMYMKRAESLR